MEEFLNNLMVNSSLPFVTAFVPGLMTSFIPCPLATNITAIGFISKDLEDEKRVFLNGLIYTGGRAIAHTLYDVILRYLKYLTYIYVKYNYENMMHPC